MWPFVSKKIKPGRKIAARMDAAATSFDNAKHWAAADSWSADAAFDAETRRIIRERTRYEYLNNTYLGGMVTTLVNDVIGTGPRLQLTGEESNRLNDKRLREAERAFTSWSNEINLPEKLRILKSDKMVSGEGLAILVNNERLEGPVKLDLSVYECDRLHDSIETQDKDNVDGVILDSFGDPAFYRILDEHPGSMYGAIARYHLYPAENVIHWFRKFRSEQHRGIPEVTAAVPLFAYLRRYNMAVVANAETVASLTAVLTTNIQSYGGNGEDHSFEEADITRDSFVTLPDGYDMKQLKAEQPGSTYEMFKREILGEIARVVAMPVNIMTGDSSRHNYASARLDHQSYQRNVKIEQSRIEREILEKIFRSWWEEYSLGQHGVNRVIKTVRWFWDGFPHVDPLKGAKATAINLESGMTNYAIECAALGLDYEDMIRQRVYEYSLLEKYQKQFGVTTLEKKTANQQDKTEDKEDE